MSAHWPTAVTTSGKIPVPSFDTVLQAVEREIGRAVGDGVDVRLEPLQMHERPASWIMQVKCARPVGRPNLFIKIYKYKVVNGDPEAISKRVRRDFDTTQSAYETFAAFAEIGAVRPLACFPQLLAIVTEESPGLTLQRYLEANVRWAPSPERRRAAAEALARVGRWITVFQQTHPSAPPQGIEGVRDYIDIRLQRLAGSGAEGFGEVERCAVLEQIEQLGARLRCEDFDRVRTHADMSLGNLLVSPERVTVLDFAMTTMDTSYHDIAKVYLQLDLLRVKPSFRPGVIRELQQALLRGFGDGATPDHPLFRLMLLQHRVNHLAAAVFTKGGLRSQLYNRAVRLHHRQWFAREVPSWSGRAARRATWFC